MNSIRRFTFLPLVLLLILMTAVAVYADRPEVVEDYDYEEELLVVDCADYGHKFKVWDHAEGHVKSTWYHDDENNVVKVIWQVHGVDNLYEKSKPDKKSEPDYLASGPFNLTAHVYPYPDWSLFWIENVTGVNWNIQLPGKGTVYHESGLWTNIDKPVKDGEELVEVVKRAGLEKRDFEMLCEFFAQ